jgi:hypothetical protein
MIVFLLVAASCGGLAPCSAYAARDSRAFANRRGATPIARDRHDRSTGQLSQFVVSQHDNCRTRVR